MRRAVHVHGRVDARVGGNVHVSVSVDVRRSRARGMTLLEILVAVVVLAMVTVLIYGSFSNLRRTQEGANLINERYHEGRQAMGRIVRELQSAYLSNNVPTPPTERIVQTAFIGDRGTPASKVHFVSFSHRRLDLNIHQSDQTEISFYGDTDIDGTTDLIRRFDPYIDVDPEAGGRAQVLATDIDLFQLEYLDGITGEWLETWDSTQAADQFNRVPYQIRITLVMHGGARESPNSERKPIRFVTTVSLPIQNPLLFPNR